MKRFQKHTSNNNSFLLTGIVTGAILFIILWLGCLFMVSGFSVMGVEAEPIAQLVFKEFLGSVIWVQVKILLTYAILGGFFGLLGAIITQGIFSTTTNQPSRWWSVIAGAGFPLAVEILMLCRAARKTPQLFADVFYLPGGWTRDVMVFITDQLPQWIVLTGLIILAATAVVSIIIFIIRRFPLLQTGTTILLAVFTATGFTLIASRQLNHSPQNHAQCIVILAADSFRQDHLSGMGYHRPTSPNIDKLIERSTVFNRAITTLPRTFPAWVSYLTGTYPSTHGVLHMFPTESDRENIPPALPDILGKHGWHSGIITDFAGDIFSRIDLGFDTVISPEFTFITLIKMRSVEIHWALMPYINTYYGRKLFPILQELAHAAYPGYLGIEARKYLKKRARRNEPFFLTVFFSATHFPYSAPDPFYRMFTDPQYAGDYKYHKPNLLKAHEDLTAEDLEHILALYDGTVHSIDNEIGKILITLDQTGLAENTWIIITGDHGENLYEGELGLGHGEHLRGNHTINVPLIIVPPEGNKAPASRVNIPVSGVDIAPTALNIAGITSDTNMEGWSLLPLMANDNTAVEKFRSRPVFSETGLWFADWTEGFYQHQRIWYPDVSKLCRLDKFHNFQIVLRGEVRDLMEVAKHRAVILDNRKLIRIPKRDGVIEEAYQIADDGREIPAEHNLSEYQPLKEALDLHLSTNNRFDVIGNYTIPNGWRWRLNRRVTIEQ